MKKGLFTITGVIDDKEETHLPSAEGDYDTLCGIELDTISAPKEKKVDCENCIAIFKLAVKYKGTGLI